MCEYKIVRINRRIETKIREIIPKKGKPTKEEYVEAESFEVFYSRAEHLLNDFSKEGWQIVNANYSLPVKGTSDYMSFGFSTTDFNSAEFVFILQRNN